MNNWIDVNNKLPEVGETVACYNKESGIDIVEYRGKKGEDTIWEAHNGMNLHPTLWLSLQNCHENKGGEMNDNLYIVAISPSLEARAQGEQWELIGVFLDEKQADAACIAKDYCYAPIKPNETLSVGALFKNCIFPRIQGA